MMGKSTAPLHPYSHAAPKGIYESQTWFKDKLMGRKWKILGKYGLLSPMLGKLTHTLIHFFKNPWQILNWNVSLSVSSKEQVII